MTEDYNDRSKWSDEDLLNKLEQMYISDEYDGGVLHAVLLARMKPEAGGWIEIDLEKDAFQLGDVMIYTDYATMINEPLVGQIPKNFSPIAVLRLIPVPPQEPPAMKDDWTKWDEQGLLNKFRTVIETNWLAGIDDDSLEDTISEIRSELIRRVRKPVDIPALSNDMPLSDPGVDVKVNSITNEPGARENAENKDKALKVARKALNDIYNGHDNVDTPQFTIHCECRSCSIVRNALAEINKLMKREK